jgi:hypothetical protein
VRRVIAAASRCRVICRESASCTHLTAAARRAAARFEMLKLASFVPTVLRRRSDDAGGLKRQDGKQPLR